MNLFKKIPLAFFAMLLISPLWAYNNCPELTGTYSCPKIGGQGDYALNIRQKTESGITSYTLTHDSQSKQTFIVNGLSAERIFYNMKASCSNNALTLFANGVSFYVDISYSIAEDNSLLKSVRYPWMNEKVGRVNKTLHASSNPIVVELK